MSDQFTTGCCSNQLLVETAPSTPYSFTTEIQQSSFAGGGGSSGFNVGLVIRDSSTGKFVTCEEWSDWSTPQLRFENWTNATTDGGTVAANQAYAGNPIGLKIVDDGTNISCYYSFDNKVHWSKISSVSRTAFMATPNQFGLAQLMWNMPSGDTAYSTFYDLTQGTN